MSAPRLLSNRYELGDTLGYGGMSEVHHGHDVRLGREVAIKILRADLARDPQFLERFRREAQNAAALNHPAIVAVYDTGEAQTENGPLPYIVMEYVQGQTLRDIVKTEGPLTEKRAMEVMADVCAALDFSHRHGIVHRDVKPANVMITKTGAVKVMDFGIARAIHDGQSAMTQTAAVIGTAQYLSPEQARGETVDARSDVYAAGCVLYELVTGEPPFTGDSPVAVAYQHVREDPSPPSSVNPAVSSELDAVVLKALAKGPANRYQSSAEMRSDLVRTLSGQRPAAPMVMTADERTQVMDDRRRAPAYEDYQDYDEDPAADADRARKRRNRLAAVFVVLGVAAVAFVMWLSGLFDQKPEPRAIPSVVGQTAPMAQDALTKAGFKPKPEDVICKAAVAGAPKPVCGEDSVGKVISVDPKEGAMAPQGSEVKMQVGKAAQKVQVPDLAGKTRAEAEKIITDLGLVVALDIREVEVKDSTEYNKVVADSQDPKAGSTTDAGNTVRFDVGKSPEMVDVTDYTGKTYDEAKEGLEAAGFEVTRSDVDSDKPKDQVTNQTPNGAKQPKGSEITLEVSNGAKEKVQLPDLTGKTEQEALALLRGIGWKGQLNKQTEKVPDKDDHGKITASSPQGGSEISKDQTITVIIGESIIPPSDETSTTPTDDGIFPPIGG